jgi:hypothetical protein
MYGLVIEQTEEHGIRDDFKGAEETVTNFVLFTAEGGCIATCLNYLGAFRRCS